VEVAKVPPAKTHRANNKMALDSPHSDPKSLKRPFPDDSDSVFNPCKRPITLDSSEDETSTAQSLSLGDFHSALTQQGWAKVYWVIPDLASRSESADPGVRVLFM
jgi:hypothetical protein